MEMHKQSDLALKYIQNTGTHLFLTGKAGTGKTTFLRRLKDLSPKRMVVVAPTGVAAINAGGVTIHSFFQLPFGPYIPGVTDQGNPSSSHKFSRDKINVIRSMDLLVIDEISMVRADLLDAISDMLCRFRDKNKPFGGVQLLLIGDMQQLAPVAKEEEWNLLKAHYASPYFFDSKALAQSHYLCVELTHVYRQSDDAFVRLLNQIRENQPDDETLRRLNERYIPDFRPDDKEGYITLTTHNYQAQQINSRKLAELPGLPFVFNAEVSDEFPAYSYPTDERLELKLGAQVMFVKNDSSGDKLYYNGKIGKIVFINNEKIIVNDERGNDITVNREVWQNVKYTINEETQEISENIAGSFSQYPLKTAWAITIHKSQGLTFEKAIIDAAAAFSHGQVYVALSRCKTLEGMVLTSRISRNALINDMRLDQYKQSLSGIQANEAYLQTAQQAYYLKLVLELFDFETVQQRLQYVAHLVSAHLARLYPEWSSRYSQSRDAFRAEVTEVGNRFQTQLRQLIEGNPSYAQDEVIQERIKKGTAYFLQQMEKYGAVVLKGFDLDIDNKETLKLLSKASNNLKDDFLLKWSVLKACREEFRISAYLSAKAKAQMEPPPAPKRKKEKAVRAKKEKNEEIEAAVQGDIRHPVLYNRIRNWRYELSVEKKLPPYTILQQKALLGIVNLLPSNSKELLMIPGIGKKVVENYGQELMEMIDRYREEIGKGDQG
ncbi:HRDC domain-containing protein [Parabacteroides sp. PF5-6]|uniref:HRDC domain-containing protein n=1 Tax=Parabacteroides sp. PF5-6 TaxID=1742403 RepID=UPI00240695F3|nr:HRDC domain-containing protein [Parabacteroides sp. PF5-6]MDF9830079.1 hypothetical protein [Parabacteroides sp. PF5-6]